MSLKETRVWHMVLFPHTWNSCMVHASKIPCYSDFRKTEARKILICKVQPVWKMCPSIYNVLVKCQTRDSRVNVPSYPFSFSFFSFSKGVNPSSLMNLFTYEKGFCFVSYLSQLCGDIKKFDSFLRVRNMTNINGIVHMHTWKFWILSPCTV